MIIHGTPILDARTYNVDFRTGILLVRPNFFKDAEADFCYQIARDSTIFRESSPKEGRTVVYGNGRLLVVGKTVIFNDLYMNCGLSPKYVRVDNERGRFAYGFVGVAFELKGAYTPKVPFELSEEIILKIYEECIADRWDETSRSSNVYKSTPSEPIKLEVKELKGGDKNLDDLLNNRNSGKIAVEDSATNRNNLIYCVQMHALNGETISLCTSFDTVTAIKQSCFEIVTCRNADDIQRSLNTMSASGTYNRQKVSKDKQPCESGVGRSTPSTNVYDNLGAPKDEPRKLDKRDSISSNIKDKQPYESGVGRSTPSTNVYDNLGAPKDKPRKLDKCRSTSSNIEDKQPYESSVGRSTPSANVYDNLGAPKDEPRKSTKDNNVDYGGNRQGNVSVDKGTNGIIEIFEKMVEIIIGESSSSKKKRNDILSKLIICGVFLVVMIFILIKFTN